MYYYSFNNNTTIYGHAIITVCIKIGVPESAAAETEFLRGKVVSVGAVPARKVYFGADASYIIVLMYGNWL